MGEQLGNFTAGDAKRIGRTVQWAERVAKARDGVNYGTQWALFEPVTVLVEAAAAGGGKYTGRILRMPAADVDEAGDLAADEVGLDVESDPGCLILNLKELGQSTHALTDSLNASEPKIFNGVVRRINADGTRVVTIEGIYAGCEDDV